MIRQTASYLLFLGLLKAGRDSPKDPALIRNPSVTVTHPFSHWHLFFPWLVVLGPVFLDGVFTVMYFIDWIWREQILEKNSAFCRKGDSFIRATENGGLAFSKNYAFRKSEEVNPIGTAWIGG